MAGEEEPYECCLSQALQGKATRELNETLETRASALRELRKSVADYPGLNSPTDNLFLLRFLRARHFDVSRSLQLIVSYFKAKQEHPDIFDNFRPSTYRLLLDKGIVVVLPHRNNQGQRIVLCRLGLWSVIDCPLLHVINLYILSIEKIIEEEETQINGVCLIDDYDAFNMYEAVHFTSSLAKKLLTLLQESLPVRVKSVHCVNEPRIIGYMYLAIRPYLSESAKKRLHYHGRSLSNLHQSFSPDILPELYGGELNDTATKEAWVAQLTASEESFISLGTYGFAQPVAVRKAKDRKRTLTY